MTANTQHTTIADYYFGFLQFLHPDSKLDLIAKLSQSLKDNKQEPTSSLQSLFGAYKSDETADEIIEKIRDSKIFNRNLESL